MVFCVDCGSTAVAGCCCCCCRGLFGVDVCCGISCVSNTAAISRARSGLGAERMRSERASSSCKQRLSTKSFITTL